MTPKGTENRPRAGRRWSRWAGAAIAAATGAAIIASWATPELPRQYRVVTTLSAGALGGLLLFLWASFFSGLPLRARRALFASGIIAAGALAAAFRIQGVSGDLVPELALRWAPPPDAELPVARPLPGRGPEAVERAEDRGGTHDFPQFLGPERRAVVRGVRLARDWEREPPRLLWRQPIGAGWSSFAIARGLAYTQEQRGEHELVTCYELGTGRLIWTHTDRVRFSSVIAGDGPRATPSIDGGRVYAFGATGNLSSLDARTGALLWTRNVLEDTGASVPDWGKSSSPLVLKDLVIVTAGDAPGSSLVAYDKATGAPAWRAGDDPPSYSSPLIATLAGRRQVISFNRASIAAHDPAGGDVLWQYPWQDEHPNVSQPVAIGGDRLLVSTGYGVGSALLEIRAAGEGEGFEVEPVWRKRSLKAKFNNVVVHGGHIYGLDDGILVCVDLASGERRWKSGRYGHGQMLLVEDLLLVTSERGAVALVEPTPEEPRELARFQALDDRTWACPALSGPRLIVRSREEVACYELPLDRVTDKEAR